ncbi:YfhO family protein [Paenibacillus sp. FA6]|uniref:YfhO family protein n=1 Tax=Paenibacillus sp. FA6 TaxID=3413029 RepID=UPI003F65ECF6
MKSITTILNKERYAILAMLICTILLYYKVLMGQLWMKWDMYEAIYPTFFSISEHIKNGSLPLWEFFVNRGVPLSHLLGIPIWSPLTLLLSLIGFNQYVIQLYFMIIIIFASIFMYLALKTYSNNSWLCAIGAVAYASSGLFISNAEHATFISAAALYPLIHFSYRKFLVGFRKEYALCLGFSIGLLILNSYPPFAIFAVFYLVIETIISYKVIRENLKRFIVQMLIAILVALSSSFITIYTTLDIMNDITRENVPWEIATSSSLSFLNWFSVLTPGLVQMAKSINTPLDISMDNTYLALPLLLPIFLLRKIDKQQLVIYFLIIISALLCMGKYGYLYRFFYEYVPGIDAFKFPSGLRFFYFFFVIVASVRILHKIISNNEMKLLQKPAKLFIGIFSVLILIIISLQYFQVTNIVLPEHFLFELVLSNLLLILLIMISEIKMSSHSYVLFFFVISFIFSVIAVDRNEDHTLGTRARPYSFNNEISQTYNQDGYTVNSFTNDSAKSESIFRREFQNQGYIGSFQLKSFQLAKENSQLAREGDPVTWFSNKTLEEININPLENSGEYPQTVNVKGNKISFQLENNHEGYMILNQTYYPGWKVKVDGKERNIIELSNSTMAVDIKSSDIVNNIVFEFKPIKVILAFWLTFTTWIILLMYFIYYNFKKIKRIVV